MEHGLAIDVQAETAISSTAATAVRLLLVTGCRKSEILMLRWEWVDVERTCLRLPDSKTGAKVVPLAAAALELLDGISRGPESIFVLSAGKGGGHYTGIQKDWNRIRTRAGLAGQWDTLHLTADDTVDLPTGTIAALIHISPS